ncbi:MAG: universal stress protein [Pseudomonadota bacterium]
MTVPTEKPVRILVALDASMQNSSALGMAAALAARCSAELRALFVEDVNLIHLAGYPFAMEIDSVSGVERKVDELTMARSLEDRIAQTRHILTRVTRSTSVRATLRVVRGHYVAEAFSAATEIDVLFLGRQRFRTQRTSIKQTFRAVKDVSAQHTPLWLLFEGTDASVRALAVANDLANSEGKKVRIAVRAENAEQAGTLRKQLGALGHSVSDIRWVNNDASGITDFLEMAKREGCGLVVANRPSDRRSNELVTIILKEADCPVVLVA